ncbi:MAG: hypothetical protein JNM86_09060 [Phycisphaerae bacterium]|nr:hypothetical protein [Phycisphaerae bacterium]MBN8597009.1 hypothetical protein [Planctomycetota bacterium]
MAADTVRIMCPNLTCRKVLAVPGNARGKTVRCKNCGTNIRVPGLNAGNEGHAKPSAPAA